MRLGYPKTVDVVVRRYVHLLENPGSLITELVYTRQAEWIWERCKGQQIELTRHDVLLLTG